MQGRACMPAVTGTHALGRGKGIEGLRGYFRYTAITIVAMGVKSNDTMPSVGRWTVHMLREGEEGLTGQTLLSTPII